MVSLMTDSFLQISPRWVELIIFILGAVFISASVYSYQNWCLLWLVLAIFSDYFGLCLSLFKYKWI